LEECGRPSTSRCLCEKPSTKGDRIAIILAHDWQQWLVAAVKVFLHPEVRVYKENEESEALKWILNGS
jgi:hypothetical protein